MRYILASLIVLLSTPAHAEWVKVSTVDDAVLFYDPEFQRRDDSIVVWTLVDHSKPREFQSAAILHEVDCVQRRTKFLQLVVYSGSMGNGDPEIIKDDFDWDFVVPGSNFGNLLDAVCP